jgi:hypothetical protein
MCKQRYTQCKSRQMMRHALHVERGCVPFMEVKEHSLHVHTEVHTAQKPSDDETCFACWERVRALHGGERALTACARRCTHVCIHVGSGFVNASYTFIFMQELSACAHCMLRPTCDDHLPTYTPACESSETQVRTPQKLRKWGLMLSGSWAIALLSGYTYNPLNNQAWPLEPSRATTSQPKQNHKARTSSYIYYLSGDPEQGNSGLIVFSRQLPLNSSRKRSTHVSACMLFFIDVTRAVFAAYVVLFFVNFVCNPFPAKFCSLFTMHTIPPLCQSFWLINLLGPIGWAAMPGWRPL